MLQAVAANRTHFLCNFISNVGSISWAKSDCIVLYISVSCRPHHSGPFTVKQLLFQIKCIIITRIKSLPLDTDKYPQALSPDYLYPNSDQGQLLPPAIRGVAIHQNGSHRTPCLGVIATLLNTCYLRAAPQKGGAERLSNTPLYRVC